MIRVMVLAAALLLPACATLRENWNCGNAAKVKAAAVKTIEAVDRACPVPAEAEAKPAG